MTFLARLSLAIFLLLSPGFTQAASSPGQSLSIVQTGAIGDGKTVNTKAIQTAIDQLATNGGGVVVVPRGVFVSGALFLKPKVNLHLEQGAVLQCSTDMANFPPQRTRIEGHFEEGFNPALLNADGCDGLRITGAGTLDGAGRPIWDLFWTLRKASPDPANFKNLSVPRARLALIQNSNEVGIDGVTFKDSQFWNLHLYKCRDVTVQNARFEVPDNYKQAPSTDGIDIDSSQDVAIKGCTFSVTDDCVAAKGSKGLHALEDKDSPPVERIRISDCIYKRGGGVITMGSEATVVRDVQVENCTVTGSMPVILCKMRGDTPQLYENIHARNITVENNGGTLLSISSWKQYTDLQGQDPPKSIVRNISLSDIKGRTKSVAVLTANSSQVEIHNVALKNIDVQVQDARFKTGSVLGFELENVVVNGKAMD